MAGMPINPNTERLRLAGAERSRLAVSAKLVEDRYRAESQALRRAQVIESGSAEERAALRAEERAEHMEGVRRARAELEQRKLADRRKLLQAKADAGDFLAALTLETECRIEWTAAEAPASVVWDPPADRRLGGPVR